MNKHDFILWLRNRLSDLPPDELDRVAGFYASAIDERVEDGMTEEAAVYALGEPEALLREIRSTLPEPYRVEPASAPSAGPVHTAKKPSRWLAACGLGLIALGLCGGILTLVRAMSGYHPFQNIAVNIEEPLPELDEAVAEVITVSEEGEVVRSSGNLCFETGTVAGVTIDLTVHDLMLDGSEDGCCYVTLPEDGSVSARLEPNGLLCIESAAASPSATEGQPVYVSLPQELTVTVACDVGEIHLNYLTVKSASVKTSVGDICLTEVCARDELYVHADCGDLNVEYLDCPNTTLECATGTISGLLYGSAEEYSVDASTAWGANSLTSGGNGPRFLKVHSDMGAIQLDFEEE